MIEKYEFDLKVLGSVQARQTKKPITLKTTVHFQLLPATVFAMVAKVRM